ncbi:peptidylprolyl isomerase [Sesbania bispinosa]|nr:peptidylprolyl isomerase [Sesbania bispinosa]
MIEATCDPEAEIPTNSQSLKFTVFGPVCSEVQFAAETTINSQPHVQDACCASGAQQAAKSDSIPNATVSPTCKLVYDPGENDWIGRRVRAEVTEEGRMLQRIAFGPTCRGAQLVKENIVVCRTPEAHHEVEFNLNPNAILSPARKMAHDCMDAGLHYRDTDWSIDNEVVSPDLQDHSQVPDACFTSPIVGSGKSLNTERICSLISRSSFVDVVCQFVEARENKSNLPGSVVGVREEGVLCDVPIVQVETFSQVGSKPFPNNVQG